MEVIQFKIMAQTIQFRRDTAANWAANNPILADGEMGIVKDTYTYKIGNGVDTWNTLSTAQLSPTIGAIDLLQGTDPGASAAGHMTLYSKALSGRAMLKMVGPSGLDTSLQPFMARNKIGIWTPPGNANTAPGVTGYTLHTVVGTATARVVTTTNLFTRMRRLGYVSAGTAGSLASFRVAVAQITTGTGTLGGFHKVLRFGISDNAPVAGARMFMGIASSGSAPTNVEPSTLLNGIGVGHGAADTNLKIFYGGSVAQTPIDLGANFPINGANVDAYDLSLFSPPSGNGEIYYEVTRLNTGDVASGVITPSGGVALPGSTTLMSYMWGYRTNNLTALAVGLDIMGDYIETDY